MITMMIMKEGKRERERERKKKNTRARLNLITEYNSISDKLI